MENKRVTYVSPKGTIYAEIEVDSEHEIGCWHHPFPNEKDNATAFGLVEAMAQSEYCPLLLREEGINMVMIERVG